MTDDTPQIEQLSCQELVELVTDYLENALPEEDRRRFDEHLDLCTGCRRYVDQLRLTIRAVGQITPDDVPPEAEEALLGAFRTWRSANA